MTRAKIALCLTGGGITGALYQIGALAALEDELEDLQAGEFDLYLGVGSGATLASTLAGGQGVQRLYRALLDPADNYFPLQRNHIVHLDPEEWRQILVNGWSALQHGTKSLFSKAPAPNPAMLWEQLDRFLDSLPAGLFSLDSYERFLEEFFVRRGIPNNFHSMPKQLRIPAYDIDSGERVVFGSEGFADAPISLACAASMALPLFFCPVRIGNSYYMDGSLGAVAHADLAFEEGADLVVMVNPMVPVKTDRGAVPTGHGQRKSLYDKGLLWVYNQASRVQAASRLEERVQAARAVGKHLVMISPLPTDATMFLSNPASFSNRRAILEFAYKSVKERLATDPSFALGALEEAGFRRKTPQEGT
jgi:NTE family protein